MVNGVKNYTGDKLATCHYLSTLNYRVQYKIITQSFTKHGFCVKVVKASNSARTLRILEKLGGRRRTLHNKNTFLRFLTVRVTKPIP